MRLRRREIETTLRMYDCRNGIPPLMQGVIDREQHVHGFDEHRAFCLFGDCGTARFGETATATGGVVIELQGSRRPKVTTWP
jgi:hypothetical protein